MGRQRRRATNHLLLPQEPSIRQGQQIFRLHLGLLSFLRQIGMRGRCWRRRLLSRSLRLIAGPLLSPTSLRALGRRRLHPPSARSFHSHPLGGCASGMWRRCAWIFSLSHGSRGDRGGKLEWMYSSGCY
jgi:hypothetical protein